MELFDLYREFSFRWLSGLEEFDEKGVFGGEFDPLDVVVGGHGVGCGADFDFGASGSWLNHR